MNTDRRRFLRMAALGCACFAVPTRAGASGPGSPDGPHWDYASGTGPAHCGSLRPDFKVCQLGLEQTPIDLAGGIKGEPGSVALDYKPIPLRIVNNGHTIQVNADPGCSCTIDGARYDLLQFHLHHPSEHLLAGKSFAMECHFVHKAETGALTVVGVFIKPGAHNADLAPLFDAMPTHAGPEVRATGSIDPSALLPREGGLFRYMGSLTTPPCSEGVTWTIYKSAIEASPAQIKQFASLFSNNARPLQKTNRRFLIETY